MKYFVSEVNQTVTEKALWILMT